jgi:hypothetical protein
MGTLGATPLHYQLLLVNSFVLDVPVRRRPKCSPQLFAKQLTTLSYTQQRHIIEVLTKANPIQWKIMTFRGRSIFCICNSHDYSIFTKIAILRIRPDHGQPRYILNKTEKSFSNLAASQFCYSRSNKSTTLQF